LTNGRCFGAQHEYSGDFSNTDDDDDDEDYPPPTKSNRRLGIPVTHLGKKKMFEMEVMD